MEKEKDVGKEAEKEIGKETEKKKKINPIKVLLRNALTSPTTLIAIVSGIIAFFTSTHRSLYLEGYYSYFDIDIKYVSKGLYQSITDYFNFFVSGFLVSIVIYFMLILPLQGLYPKWEHFMKIKDDKSLHPSVVNYIKKQLAIDSIKIFVYITITLFVTCIAQQMINAPLYDEKGMPYDRTDIIYDAFITIVNWGLLILLGFITVILFYYMSYFINSLIALYITDQGMAEPQDENSSQSNIEKIYLKLFPNNRHDDDFKKRQMDELAIFKQPLYKRHTFLFVIAGLIFLGLTYLGDGRSQGIKDAHSQREFLVTEDNKHVAIPISESRYALIDIREEGDCLILLTGKQDFHESNDFPCIRKTYEEVRKEPLN